MGVTDPPIVPEAPPRQLPAPVAPPAAPRTPQPLPHRRLYLPLRFRLLLVSLVSLLWAAFSAYIAIPWIRDLGTAITLPVSIAVVAGIAIVPGYLNFHLLLSLLLDRSRPLRFDMEFPAITLLVACFNEAEQIEETLAYAARQDYPGPFEIVVVDDGSTDESTHAAARHAELDARTRVLALEHQGKANALTAALSTVTTPLVATLDADTLLMPTALKRAVARLLMSPTDMKAIAGAMMVRNSRNGFITRCQEWDYFLGIAAVKRQQGFLQGTLVAQGAFSVYRTDAVKAVGGWPDCIGEDIVLTWALLREGGRTGFERTAIAFTDAPETVRALSRQRRRWARGMIEGLREHGMPLVRRRKAFAHSVVANFVFPYLDTVYAIAFPTGLVLAAFGCFLIVGPMTLLVLPLNLAVAGVMHLFSRGAFGELGLRVRRNRLGLLGYLLLYQFIISPASVAGYVQELLRARRRW
jgi:biofilm PGA synthesis N-glycosyltransferase PgaC